MIADILRTGLYVTGAATAAMVLVSMLRAPLRRLGGAAAAYALWLLVPAAVAWGLLPAPTVVVPAASFGVVATSMAATSPTSVDASTRRFPESGWIALWSVGAAFAVVVLWRQQRRFVRALGTLETQHYGIQLAAPGKGCPAVVGLFPPRLVLPRDFAARYGDAERELILAHERVHLARGDAYVNAFAALLRCLFWFHPLMPFAAARFRQDQELACDAAVLRRFPRARRAYADAMLKTQLADLGLPVGCHWQSSHPLRERIAMLKHPLPGLLRRALGAAVVAALASGGGYAAWASQPATAVAATTPSRGFVDANFDVSIDGGAPQHARVINPLGQPFALHGGEGAQRWGAEFTASALADDQIDIAGTLQRDGKTVSAPRLVVREGEPGEIKVGEQHGAQFQGMAVRMTLARTDRATPAPAPTSVPVATAPVAEQGAGYGRMSPPAWPAGVQGKQGTVVLRVLVGIDGKPKQVEVERTTESADAFRDTAIATVKTWEFQPAEKDGRKVERWALVPLRFGAGATPEDIVDKRALNELRVAEPKKPATPAKTTAAIKSDAPPPLPPPPPPPIPPPPPPPEPPLPADNATPATAAEAASRGASEDVSFRSSNAPVYPPVAIRENFGAKVVLKVQVRSDGTPGEVSLVTLDLQGDTPRKGGQPATETVRKTVAEAISQASIAAVKSWRFNPAVRDGKAVDDWITVPVDFALSGAGT